MKKTSRRSFGKQLTGALAALPVVSLTTKSALGRAVDEQNKPSAAGREEKFVEHDTPPPLMLIGGSLILEAITAKNDWNTLPTPAGGRRRWLVVPTPYPNGMSPSDIYIAHVKLVDGAGEMLFYFDNADTADKETVPMLITATIKKGATAFGECKVTASGNQFEIDLPITHKIKEKDPASDPPSLPVRKRVRYMDSGASDEVCDLAELRIDKGAVNLFSNTGIQSLPGRKDIRVMIWWENKR